MPNCKTLTLKTKINNILEDEWVWKDKYAEERLDLIDLLTECKVSVLGVYNRYQGLLDGRQR
jgi:hypothetical protein